jgi:DNA-directed RNA polymerase subunit L
MTVDIDEFRKYLKIDKQALDDEVMQQPSLFFEVSEAYTLAVAERDALKEELNVTDAKYFLNHRRSDPKATDTAIKNRVSIENGHQQAFTEYLEAKEYADKLSALKDAFNQRSEMLKALGRLYASNYFEQMALKPTQSTDAMVYQQRRKRLAIQREKQK